MVKFSFLYNLLNLREPDSVLTTLVRKFMVIFEMCRIILNKKVLKLEETVLVYDCKVSPATKGDFFHLLMLLRTLQALNYKVRIIILKGEYRDSWHRRYNKTLLKSHLEYMNSMMQAIKLKKNAIMEYMSWSEYKKYEVKINQKKTFILFSRKVRMRRPIYTHDINLMNYLLNKNKDLQNQVLLKSKDIKVKIKKLPRSDYIAIGCRHEPKRNTTQRNISKKLFIKLIKKMETSFPKQKKIIISDKKGCNYFKKIVKKNSFKCLFSKDFSKDYLGDGKIILNSSIFFQLEGGGIMEFAIFSKLSFLISTQAYTPFEYQWKKNYENSWHESNQIYLRPSAINKSFLSDKGFFSEFKNFKYRYLNNQISI